MLQTEADSMISDEFLKSRRNHGDLFPIAKHSHFFVFGMNGHNSFGFGYSSFFRFKVPFGFGFKTELRNSPKFK